MTDPADDLRPRATVTLAEFLLARVAEDEAVALLTWDDPQPFPLDPARVLAECEAKRRIVDMAGRSFMPGVAEVKPHMSATQTMAWLNLVYLAQPYADHPEFDPAWRV